MEMTTKSDAGEDPCLSNTSALKNKIYCDRKLQKLSISAEHRIKMLSLALNDSDWIKHSI